MLILYSSLFLELAEDDFIIAFLISGWKLPKYLTPNFIRTLPRAMADHAMCYISAQAVVRTKKS